MPVPTRPATARRTALPLLVLVLLLVASLSGCARVRAALAVQPDDTVTGEIVLATPQADPADLGPQVTVPADLTGDVEVAPYAADGYAGSVLRFEGLTFAEVGRLTEAAGPAGDRARLELRRVGGRVLVSGAADLTTVSVDRADFQLKISFPGDLVETNGDADRGTVSWTFAAGEVGDVTAVAAYADPGAPSALNWTLLLAALVAAAAAGVVLLARRTRNPPVSSPLH